jgi:hypothetical protein
MGFIQSPRHKTEINCIVIDKVKTRWEEPLLPADSTVTGNDMITMKRKNHINLFYWGGKTRCRDQHILQRAGPFDNTKLLNLSKSLYKASLRAIESRKMKWARHVVCTRQKIRSEL